MTELSKTYPVPARVGSRASRRRWFAAAIALAGIAVTASGAVFAEAPAHLRTLADPSDFGTAFAPYELSEKDASPGTATVAAAEARYAQAPVEMAEEIDDIGSGNASYYGAGFAGRPTASGERFNPADLTAAHRTLPFGTKVKVTNISNGRSVIVRINDRGPFHGNRVIDLSREAARQIGLIGAGQGRVQLASLAP